MKKFISSFILILVIFILANSESIDSKSIENNSKNEISLKCSDIPYSFNSYEEAHYIIQNTKFKFVDRVNTSKSSWIRSARYYSCDKQVGFFAITTDDGLYIHQDVPIDIWYAFKNADSFGSFYVYYLRGSYRLRVNYEH